jgi:acetyltransferase
MDKMIRYCRGRGTGEIVGQVLLTNKAMLDLAQSLGFESHTLPDAEVVEVRLKLEKG